MSWILTWQASSTPPSPSSPLWSSSLGPPTPMAGKWTKSKEHENDDQGEMNLWGLTKSNEDHKHYSFQANSTVLQSLLFFSCKTKWFLKWDTFCEFYNIGFCRALMRQVHHCTWTLYNDVLLVFAVHWLVYHCTCTCTCSKHWKGVEEGIRIFQVTLKTLREKKQKAQKIQQAPRGQPE